MKIGCISRTNYWQGTKGGMDLHLRLLGEGLFKRGHRLDVISTAHPDVPEFMEKNGVIYHHLPDTVFGSRRQGWPEKSIRRFLALNEETHFDLLWSQSFDAYGVVPLKPKADFPPVLLTLHGSVAQEVRSFRSNLHRLMGNPPALARGAAGLLYSYFIVQRRLLAYAGNIIAVSPVVSDDIRRWFGRGPAAKCTVIPNGIDLERFRPDMAARRRIREEYGISDDQKVVLSLGRLTFAKGHHLAMEAVEIMAARGLDVRLMIAGAGPYMNALKKSVKERGMTGRVIFTGHIENDLTAAYYNAADLFVMPTLTLEGLPFVLLEAMACEKPVIATRRGGNLELIRDSENGLLVEPGRSADLGEKMTALLGAPALCAELARNARITIEQKYGLEVMIDRYATVMESIARRRCFRGVSN